MGKVSVSTQKPRAMKEREVQRKIIELYAKEGYTLSRDRAQEISDSIDVAYKAFKLNEKK